MSNPFFEEKLAQRYEQWYEIGEGRRADLLEKELLGKLLSGFDTPDFDTGLDTQATRPKLRDYSNQAATQPKGFSDVQSLLEIGCGTGHFTRYFATLLPFVVGLDISPAMLKEARRRNVSSGIPYLMGDALRLPFSDASFDVVAFITTLDFIDEPQQALKEAGRVARQGLLLGVLNAVVYESKLLSEANIV